MFWNTPNKKKTNIAQRSIAGGATQSRKIYESHYREEETEPKPNSNTADFGGREEQKHNHDLQETLNSIEEHIRDLGRQLSKVYNESQTAKDTSRRLELEDRRRDLRKQIIEAHEEFKTMLEKNGKQNERKAEESRRTAAESKTEDRTEELLSKSRMASLETELALARSRRLINLELLTDLDLVSFRMPYYYRYYSYLYPYTYSYLSPYRYSWLSPYRSLYDYDYYPSYLSYLPYRYLDPYYYYL